MKKHIFYLEDIMEEIRNLSEYYPINSENGDAFELTDSELKPFAEELIATINRFLDVDVSIDDDDALIDDDDDDDVDMFFFDPDDDLS